jgi:hypothetical protein
VQHELVVSQGAYRFCGRVLLRGVLVPVRSFQDRGRSMTNRSTYTLITIALASFWFAVITFAWWVA